MEQAETSRLAWAVVVSLVLHLLIFGGYELGKRYHVWQNLRWPAWMQSPKMLTELLRKPAPAQTLPPRQEIPLTFVEVNPAVATPEPPKKAAYYSSMNSAAANRDISHDTEKPLVDGQQTRIVKTEDIENAKSVPAKPTPQPAPKTDKAQEETKPKGDKFPLMPGGLAKAEDKTENGEKGQAEHHRPRTIQEAMALPKNAGLVGERMKQEGGVRRHAIQSSLDTRATTFGAYDSALVAAVQNRWDDLLEHRSYSGDAVGKVKLKFRLHPDGSISELRLVESTVDLTLALLCQSAIRDPAPFGPWPSDMKAEIQDNREVTFTFYYY